MFTPVDSTMVDSAMEMQQESSVRPSLIVKLRIPAAMTTKLSTPTAQNICNGEQQSLAVECNDTVPIDKTKEMSKSGCWTPIEPNNASLFLDLTGQNSQLNSVDRIQNTPVCKSLVFRSTNENIDCTTAISRIPESVLATKRDYLTITTPSTSEGIIKTQVSDSPGPCGRDTPSSTSIEPANKVQEKPILQFMFQRPNGRPDRKNLISRKTWLDMSLSNLFAAVSNRTERAQDSLSCVTLRYLDWGEGEALIVQRTDGEDEWKDIKDEIVMVFKDATMEYPNRKEFLVWIKCGDRTKMETKEEAC
jgi:hypothetical protein